MCGIVLLMVLSVLIPGVYFSSVSGSNFNTNDVIVINEGSVKNTYFSYSLLLQADRSGSSLIIGAPKSKNDSIPGGNLYNCNIEATNRKFSCQEYPVGRSVESADSNGNFFSMSLDGDSRLGGPLVACSVKTKTHEQYLRGYCVYMTNSSQATSKPQVIKPLNEAGMDTQCCDSNGKVYYNMGYAMAGFDVAFHSKDEILFGAPGAQMFSGLTASYSVSEPRLISLLPHRTKVMVNDGYSYFGYSVGVVQNPWTKNIWLISGAPRANYLKGKVTLYYYDVSVKQKMHIVSTFQGDETGSYFGACVLGISVVDDGTVDILVAAPMAAGASWDEGHVFFYKGLNENSFMRGVKLTGGAKMGGRFGTAIAPLGDIDLDGYKDVAISAPYEDEGKGAVYIYKGTPRGLNAEYDQRLSPDDFNIGNLIVKGFGLGMSKGNDINADGHNDLAIGAYKTDQVFIVQSYSIINYHISVKPQINTITNETTNFTLLSCIAYTKRSKAKILETVKFGLTIEADYRSLVSPIIGNISPKVGVETCQENKIFLRTGVMDISPFQLNLRIETKTKNLIAHGDGSRSIQIPYSHGCGDDNICDTDLSIDLATEKESLVLGRDKQLALDIFLYNRGEPAYGCKVTLTVPEGLALRNEKHCIKNEGNYTCTLSDQLIESAEESLEFDVKYIEPSVGSLQITAEVTSLGANDPESNRNKAEIIIPVVLENTPYIVGKSIPEDMELDIRNGPRELEAIHQFSIGNDGPSPLLVDTEIFIPTPKQNGENIFSIVDVEGVVDNIRIPCVRSAIDKEVDGAATFQVKDLVINRTVIVTCSEPHECTKYVCKGEYLDASMQLAVLNVKILINTKLLVEKYRSSFLTKDLIAFLPTAYQTNLTERISATAQLLIFVEGQGFVPLWVYLLAPAIGVILLIFIIFALYKCHFFNRIYKEKLQQEQTLISSDSSAIEDQIFDDVVFRSMDISKP